jgi:hypothetical protein
MVTFHALRHNGAHRHTKIARDLPLHTHSHIVMSKRMGISFRSTVTEKTANPFKPWLTEPFHHHAQKDVEERWIRHCSAECSWQLANHGTV